MSYSPVERKSRAFFLIQARMPATFQQRTFMVGIEQSGGEILNLNNQISNSIFVLSILYMGFGSPSLPPPPGSNTCITCPDGHIPIIKGGCTTSCFETSKDPHNAPEQLDKLCGGLLGSEPCVCAGTVAEEHTFCCTKKCNTGSNAGLRISEIAALAVNNCYDDRGVGHKNNFYGGYMARKVGRVMRYDPKVTKRQPNTACYCCK